MTNSQNYDQNLKIIASFDTVQSFWDVYSYLARPSDLVGLHCDLHVFKSGIKPLWEVRIVAKGLNQISNPFSHFQ